MRDRSLQWLNPVTGASADLVPLRRPGGQVEPVTPEFADGIAPRIMEPQ